MTITNMGAPQPVPNTNESAGNNANAPKIAMSMSNNVAGNVWLPIRSADDQPSHFLEIISVIRGKIGHF
jgi:hypothetical protein